MLPHCPSAALTWMWRKPHLSNIIPQGLLQWEKQLAVKVITDAQPGVSNACQSGANQWGKKPAAAPMVSFLPTVIESLCYHVGVFDFGKPNFCLGSMQC
jgi:hypothetical protein